MVKAKMKPTKGKKAVRTQVCFLLDETASMAARKKETIEGFNAYLKDLKKDQGDEVLFTFTTFNKAGIKTRHKAEPVENVRPLNEETYNPQQWTPLYDAVGVTMAEIKDSIKKTDLVIFVILTDGEENSSREYTKDAVTTLIKDHEKDGWKFVFLGVGIDAFATGGGIGLGMASTFNVSTANAGLVYDNLSVGTTNMRSTYSNNGLQATATMNVLSEKDRKKLQG